MFIALVPAYNEQMRIGSVVRNLFEHVDEVLVIDDCSTDDTAKIAKEAGAVILSHHVNRGQGAALQTGHDYAIRSGAEYVLHFDGDNQFNAADIPGALKRLKQEQADVLLGSRFLGVRSNLPFFKRYFIQPIAKIVNRIFTGIKLSDAHNGFRILNRNALRSIVITQDRMAHSTEITSLIKKYDLVYTEHPIEVRYFEYGQGMFGGVRIVKDLIIGKFLN